MLIATATLFAGLLAGWIIFGGAPLPETAMQEHDHAAETKGETTWTCSMHPQIRQPEPGDCPICGMDLISLENDDSNGADPMAISMSPAAMQLASISTSAPMRMLPEKEVRLNGKVAADERRIISQSSHVPGRIEQLHVNFTGAFVRKGQTIATVYSPDLVTAQEELLEAYKIRESQPGLFRAAREKLKNWKLTEEQVDQLLATGKTMENFPVKADVSGYVTNKMVHPGDYVTRGEPLYEITDLSRVWILFDLYETDIPWISVNDPVEFIIRSLPGKTFGGKITYIDPVIDPLTRVAKARVSVPNGEAELKPEMFVSGTVQTRLEDAGEVMVIPESAVMWTGTRSVVFVKQTTDQGVGFSMRKITLGPSLGDSYIVQEGLDFSEEIAVHGTFSIDAAAQLAGKPSMMNPEGTSTMTDHDHGGKMDGGEMAGSETPGDWTTGTQVPEVEISAGDAPGMKAGAAIPGQDHLSERADLSDGAKKELIPVYTDYFSLTEQLASDDFEQAQQSARALKESLGKVDMEAFSGDAHAIWMDHLASLEKATEDVGSYQSIEALRSAFIGISNAMIALAHSFGSPDETIYLQHCPMADNDKGADWLSLQKEIRNPYFGDMMLKCGETKDTLENSKK